MLGNWAHDVTYLIVSALPIEQRAMFERDLLVHYLEELKAYGIDAPDFETAWRAYREHVMYGFMWIVCPPENQPEDVIVETAHRFAAGAADLDTPQLLLEEL